MGDVAEAGETFVVFARANDQGDELKSGFRSGSQHLPFGNQKAFLKELDHLSTSGRKKSR
jgi:hypothetical protein